jgi:hypothetical protein
LHDISRLAGAADTDAVVDAVVNKVVNKVVDRDSV